MRCNTVLTVKTSLLAILLCSTGYVSKGLVFNYLPQYCSCMGIVVVYLSNAWFPIKVF